MLTEMCRTRTVEDDWLGNMQVLFEIARCGASRLESGYSSGDTYNSSWQRPTTTNTMPGSGRAVTVRWLGRDADGASEIPNLMQPRSARLLLSIRQLVLLSERRKEKKKAIICKHPIVHECIYDLSSITRITR